MWKVCHFNLWAGLAGIPPPRNVIYLRLVDERLSVTFSHVPFVRCITGYSR